MKFSTPQRILGGRGINLLTPSGSVFLGQMLWCCCSIRTIFLHRLPCPLVVGRDRSYPARKPRSATLELLSRYLLPAVPTPQLAAPGAKSGDVVGCNLEAVRQIQKIAVSANVEFLLAVTPKRGEFGRPALATGKSRLERVSPNSSKQRKLLT